MPQKVPHEKTGALPVHVPPPSSSPNGGVWSAHFSEKGILPHRTFIKLLAGTIGGSFPSFINHHIPLTGVIVQLRTHTQPCGSRLGLIDPHLSRELTLVTRLQEPLVTLFGCVFEKYDRKRLQHHQ